jgi:hypothetical protein
MVCISYLGVPDINMVSDVMSGAWKANMAPGEDDIIYI